MILGNRLLGVCIVLFSGAVAAAAIDELNMGLSKSSVFDTPTPHAASYPDIKPGKSDRLPKAYETLPPQITHRVEEYLPITLEDNECMDCHDKRKMLGRTWQKGKKLPMPDNHYGSFEKQGGVEDVAGARYNCMQCHVPMSDARPLVENTFR
ncbi:MAG: nitrate reductase cytochrome c-type subunit [Gammaproteobacteria bacterium]|jgi:nitrate reductase (cytochrome), electron transfer subunit